MNSKLSLVKKNHSYKLRFSLKPCSSTIGLNLIPLEKIITAIKQKYNRNSRFASPKEISAQYKSQGGENHNGGAHGSQRSPHHPLSGNVYILQAALTAQRTCLNSVQLDQEHRGISQSQIKADEMLPCKDTYDDVQRFTA